MLREMATGNFYDQAHVPIPIEACNMLKVKNINTQHYILEEQAVPHFLYAHKAKSLKYERENTEELSSTDCSTIKISYIVNTLSIQLFK